MKHVFILMLLTVFCACNGTTPVVLVEETETKAFPEAEGAGAVTIGGNGGTVYFVTSLEDKADLPGTLRYALGSSVSRTILFKVAGTINLASELRIRNGNVSILGQSAPGDGICIKGYPVIIDADNVIIRFIRFRMGDENAVEGDALTCVGCNKVVIDHCSMSWSTDECASCYGNTNFTMQYCIIAESLRKSVHDKGTHGYGGIWGGSNATFHHNLLAHHDSRNPRFDHDYVSTKRGPLDFVNNVIYNWGGNSAYGGESTAVDNTECRTINMANNYYKAGPATRHKNRIINPTVSCSNCNHEDANAVLPPHLYITGNYVAGYPDVTADNWNGGVQGVSSEMLSVLKSTERFDIQEIKNLQTAEIAYETVLAKAGASLKRDTIDARIIGEVQKGTFTYTGSNGSTNGLIDTQTDVGGWPDYCYTNTDVSADTDQDGIPDDWETAHGLDKTSALDAKKNTLQKSYSNLEVYLNSLVEHLY